MVRRQYNRPVFPRANVRNPDINTQPARVPSLSSDADNQIVHDLLNPLNRAVVSYALGPTAQEFADVYVHWEDQHQSKHYLRRVSLICKYPWSYEHGARSTRSTYWYNSLTRSVDPCQSTPNRDLTERRFVRRAAKPAVTTSTAATEIPVEHWAATNADTNETFAVVS